MEEDIDMDDIMNSIDPDESDFFYSDEEYIPDENGYSSDEHDTIPPPPRKKKKKAAPAANGDDDFDEDDDLPLSLIRDRLVHQQNELAAEIDEVLTQMLNEPMWVRMPFTPNDNTFIGDIEQEPDELKTPYKFFCELITDDMIESIEHQTNMYAMTKSGIELNSTRKEIEKFIGIYLLMGLVKAHSVRAYWARWTRHSAVADVMKRNRFLSLCSTIHFTDNDRPIDGDRIWKLRPWLNRLKENLEKIPPVENQSVDEIMIAFKGRSVVKQFMRNKPHKWGIKVWARAGSDGILHDFTVYQAVKTTTKSKLGMTGEVVMDMVKKLKEGKNYKVFADNLFSSLQLAISLKEKGILYTGTVRENRLKGCEFRAEKDMKKDQRGVFDRLVEVDNNVIAVRWYDNKKVDVISSSVGVEPVTTVSRYDRQKKERINVPCPAVIKSYNRNMGGVDLLDSLTALYKAKMKTRRWYLYIFYHSLNMVVVTSWLWYRRHCALRKEKAMKLSEFQGEVAFSLINVERNPGRPSLQEANAAQRAIPTPEPSQDVRLDGVNHLPVYRERQTCKLPECSQKSLIMCSKCKKHLCINNQRNCFVEYHTRKIIR